MIAADKPYIQHITQSLELPDPIEVDRVLKDVFQEGLLSPVSRCVLVTTMHDEMESETFGDSQ